MFNSSNKSGKSKLTTFAFFQTIFLILVILYTCYLLFMTQLETPIDVLDSFAKEFSFMTLTKDLDFQVSLAILWGSIYLISKYFDKLEAKTNNTQQRLRSLEVRVKKMKSK